MTFLLNRFLGLVTFFSLSAIFFVTKTINEFETNSKISLWDAKFSILNLVVSILFLGVSLSTAKPQKNMAFFWIFQYIFFGIAGIAAQLDPVPYYLTQISTVNDLTVASQIVTIAQLTVCAGQLIALTRMKQHLRLSTSGSELNITLLTKRIKLLLILYFFIIPFVISELGGITFLTKRIRIDGSTRDLSTSLNAIYESILYVPPLIAILVLVFLHRVRNVPKVFLILLIIWIVVLSNPLGNARQTTLFFILPLLFVYFQSRIKISILFFTSLPYLLLYSAEIVNRYTGEFQKPQLTVISRDGDFDSFAQLANGVQLTAHGHFPILRQISSSILFFIPRSTLPNKPYDTGVELAKLLGLRFQNLSAPWILESYVNLRLGGVCIIAFLLGYYLCRMDLTSNNEVRNFLLSALSSGFLFIVLRGSLLQATGRVVFSVSVLYLVFRNTKIKRQPTFQLPLHKLQD